MNLRAFARAVARVGMQGQTDEANREDSLTIKVEHLDRCWAFAT